MKTPILIVEDETIVAEDLAAKLRRLNYEIVGIAAEGEEAVEMAGRLHPHLILMDVRLQGTLDGIAAAQAIHAEHDIPIIYLTAHSDTDTLSRAKETGPFGYILKPFEERDLATQIELALYKHEAETRIREQREWLRVTLSSIGDAVIATDAESRISFLNPSAESLTGWTADEATGRPLTEVFRIINENSGLSIPDPVSEVLREGRVVPLSNHAALVTRDGRSIPIEDSAAPILDSAGTVIGVVLVFHDVTIKRRAEEAVLKSRDELEIRVKERTSDLETLMQKLQENNQTLREFAAIASHDLQEPLRKVMVFGRMLHQKYAPLLGDDGKGYLNRILNATERMQSLLKALLDYSRITIRDVPFEPSDLGRIIRDVISDLEVLLTQTGGSIEIGDLPVVFADPIQMRQLFQNLLGNALKFHKDGTFPEIGISGMISDEQEVRIIVRDNGIGFDRQYLDRIFAPFQRLHETDRYSGTGMGLAICKKIVERHGGAITAESSPGNGAIFTVTLPMGTEMKK